MISINNVNVSFGGFTLLNDINFHITDNDRIGLVGKNGAGKSTLLKLILGINSPTGGKIMVPPGLTIGYLPQQTDLQRDFPASVREVVMSGFAGKSRGFGYTKQMKTENYCLSLSMRFL
mgnify:CR=1 FL=1